MGRKISIVLFWAIILLSVLALSRMTWQDWRGSLRIAAFVVPFVLLTAWFENRFVGRRKRAARVMIYSVCFAMVSGSILLWDLMLFRSGFEAHGGLAEPLAAGAVFIASSSVFFWSLSRLLRRADKLPT